MQEVKSKPTISSNSRQIALNSARFSAPIYSPQRYQQELDQYLSRKEEAARLKLIIQREKEMAEMEEIQRNSIHAHIDPDRKLDKNEFLRKYNNQVRLWENRVYKAG